MTFGRPAIRISVGLVSLTAGILLLGDLLGLIPRVHHARLETRNQVTEMLAVQASLAVGRSDLALARKTLELFQERNDDVVSVALRLSDGRVLIQSGNHLRHWESPEGGELVSNQALVPLYRAGRPWGSLEVRFRPTSLGRFPGIPEGPILRLVLFVSLAGFLSYWLFMRRTLRYLDPSAVIPERVKTTLDALAEGVVLVDTGGRIVLANEAFAGQVGRMAPDLLGNDLSRLGWTSPETGEAPDELPWSRATQKGHDRIGARLNLSSSSSESRTLMVSSAPILDGDGKRRGALATFDDVTLLEEVNAELQALAGRDREAREAAEAAARAKSEFLATMSHEIRTPMNVVLGMANILEDTELSSDQKECVSAVQTAGDALLTIINDVLDFSKIEAGKLELEHVDFSLRECLEDVAEILSGKAYEKGLEFPVVVRHECADRLLGDPGRLKQVLMNLASNAIKFTAHGEVEIRVSEEARGERESHLRFEVRDTGIGISASQMDRLFRGFSQVDASTTRRYGGTGLGLAICKRLIEAMDGRIGVESREGSGSTFWFEVSFDRDAHAAREARSLDEISVLVIWPHQASAEALIEQVRSLGGTAIALNDPAEALRSVRAGNAAGPRVVLAHHPLAQESQMPYLDALLQIEDLSVFLVPARATRSAAEGLLDRGFAGLLSRPIRSERLLRILEGAVGLEEPPQKAAAASEVALEDHRNRGRYRILLADDYPLNRKLALRLLERRGYQCDGVENGREAVSAAESGAYDLVLMDCQMPEMDGFDATREIRRREEESGEHLWIIAMTANAGESYRELCLDAGMDDYLSKPIDVEVLHALLEKYLPESISSSLPGELGLDRAGPGVAQSKEARA